MSDFKKLLVWQRSRTFAKSIFEVVRRFPRGEGDDAGSQLRRSALSIPTNLAEGCAQQSDREQARFFRMALASAREVESVLLSAGDVGFVTRAESPALEKEIDEIQRMLTALIKHRMKSGIRRRLRRVGEEEI